MTIRVKAPGSCGELVQGTINGANFLITAPIDWYSEVTIVPHGSMTQIHPKTAAAVKSTLKYLQSAERLGISVSSDLPVGKGMASSSADISAACQAASLAVAGRLLTCDEIADLALMIEPTDGIFYPGIIQFDHVHGTIRRLLGSPPPISIAVFDVGGEVDTVAFNDREDLARLNQEKEPDIVQAVELVTQGLILGDARLIGRGATISALANQAILFKPHLEAMINISTDYGAVGVCVAHSGTVVGVMFSENITAEIGSAITQITRKCSNVIYLKTVQLISGGLIVTGDDDLRGR